MIKCNNPECPLIGRCNGVCSLRFDDPNWDVYSRTTIRSISELDKFVVHIQKAIVNSGGNVKTSVWSCRPDQDGYGGWDLLVTYALLY